uniref:Uncharacterized protein n=1 Tax=Lepeophtheirus salmonis TaxID=72036 RepID=A0A0K2UUT6_LEPSM
MSCNLNMIFRKRVNNSRMIRKRSYGLQGLNEMRCHFCWWNSCDEWRDFGWSRGRRKYPSSA